MAKKDPKGKDPRNRKVTLLDIAAAVGVSRGTVSLVLRKSPLVKDETRKRVEAAIEELGYVYDRGAAYLRSRKTNTIGLVICNITNPFYAEFTSGVDAALENGGWLSIFGNSGESADRQERILTRMREQAVDGIILVPAANTPEKVIRSLQRWGFPFVQATRHVLGEETDFVGQDHFNGVRMAVDHLVSLGHRRIAFIGGAERHSASVERQAGYQAAMQSHGLVGSNQLIVPCVVDPVDASRAILEALAHKPRPTAAVCFNDHIAYGVVGTLVDQGIRPGTDFAVVGFDDRRDIAFLRPALTTVSISAQRVAEAAVGLLQRRIAHPSEPPERIIISPRLVIRESCGAKGLS